VNVFDLDRALVSDYSRFARSFTQIRAPDIRAQVEQIYATNRFWPEPLISINPHFEPGASVEELAREGTLHPDTARVFRVDGQAIRFHRHQAQAIAKAAQRKSFAVTTGTGSGKSLCFFVPIIDAAIRARSAGEAARTRAIVIYPMNALANSQMKELDKFIEQAELPDRLRPTFARYTGQESQEERERIREAKPDIMLTNFMMLELLMTRQNTLDRAVMDNAQGLDFIVLDELHTYRGRQGADVAMLVRRVRDRLCSDHAPICIGTSATMASEGEDIDRATAVAGVASRLFGTAIGTDAVIDESLERATDPSLKSAKLGKRLAAVSDACERLIEVGGVDQGLVHPLVPQAVRLADQHAERLGAELGPSLPQPEGVVDRGKGGRRGAAKIAFDAGFERAQRGERARIHAEAVELRRHAEVAPLHVGRTVGERDRLHCRRARLVAAVEIGPSRNLGKAIKSHLGQSAWDSDRESGQVGTQRVLKLLAHRLGGQQAGNGRRDRLRRRHCDHGVSRRGCRRNGISRRGCRRDGVGRCRLVCFGSGRHLVPTCSRGCRLAFSAALQFFHAALQGFDLPLQFRNGSRVLWWLPVLAQGQQVLRLRELQEVNGSVARARTPDAGVCKFLNETAIGRDTQAHPIPTPV
jgi:DEAD/DEAH box helicase